MLTLNQFFRKNGTSVNSQAALVICMRHSYKCTESGCISAHNLLDKCFPSVHFLVIRISKGPQMAGAFFVINGSQLSEIKLNIN